MSPGSGSWDFTIPAGVRLLVVLLVVWPIVCDMPIYDGFLNMYMFFVLHVLYIQSIKGTNNDAVSKMKMSLVKSYESISKYEEKKV
jgi:hypothetical protein